jgi:hypothetical protein
MLPVVLFRMVAAWKRVSRLGRRGRLGFAVFCAGFISARSQAWAFQPNTLRIGTVEVHPSVTAEVVYNDNISLTHERTGDVIFRERPGVSLVWERTWVPVQAPRVVQPEGMSLDFLIDLYLSRIAPLAERGYLGLARPAISVGKPVENAILSGLKFRRYSLLLDYQPDIIQLVNHPQFNSVDHDLVFGAEARFPGGLYARLDDRFVSSTTVASYRKEVVDFNAAQRSEGIGFHSNILSFRTGYNFYADYLVFLTYTNYLFFVRNFDAAQVLADFQFPPLIELEAKGVTSGTLGMNLQTAGLYVATVLVRKTAISLGYVVGRLQGNLEDFGVDARLLGEEVPVTLRVREDPRNAWFHEVRLGFQRPLTSRASVFGWPVPKTLVEGSVAYQWRNMERSVAEVRAAGESLLEIPIQARDVREPLVDLRLSSELRPRTRIEVQFSRVPREAVGGTGNMSIDWEAQVALAQEMARKFVLDLRGLIRYREMPEQAGLEDHFWDYQTDGSLSYRIQSWLQVRGGYQFLARDADQAYNAFQSHRVRAQVFLSF